MDSDFNLHQPTYEWTVKVFNRVRRMLGLNIKLHGNPELLDEGEIFVFNHFARIETFLPHFIIYQHTGALCRCIGAKALFKGNDAFAKYLTNVGVIPNDCDELFPILVAEIIRGRKVIIFPEGGMVKDRKVINEQGKYRIYSRSAQEDRKHHSGAAVLASALNTVKQAIIYAEKENDWDYIDQWLEMLEMDDKEQLLFSVHKPTTIVPCNITFYPMSDDKNFLYKQIKFFSSDLSKQAKEELIIESNLLLKDTDMDMRLGLPIVISEEQSWWQNKVQFFLAKGLRSIDHFFSLDDFSKLWVNIIQKSFQKGSGNIRDKYMKAIYQEITINICHLASGILIQLSEKESVLDLNQYYLCVYLAIKNLQQSSEVHLHRGLHNPDSYASLAKGDSSILEDFLQTAQTRELIKVEDNELHLLDNLTHEFERGTARLRNPIQVYTNEMAPISGAVNAVKMAVQQIQNVTDELLSGHFHDDELRSYQWHQKFFNKEIYDEVNEKETATESGRPYLMVKRGNKKRKNIKKSPIGVVLVHGFLSTPAEVKPLADKLHNEGCPVYAVRMAGHGTSPADLLERNWQSWVKSVENGYQILKPYADKIVILGFSTGSIAAFMFASKLTEYGNLCGIIGVNSPMKFQDKKMMLVPLIHNVSNVIKSVSPIDGILPYRPNDSEHPDVNYKSIPVNGLYELLQLNTELKKNLKNIKLPCLIMQSSEDPIISADSGSLLQSGLINADVSYVEIESKKHGIIYESIGATHYVILDFIKKIEKAAEDNEQREEERA